MARMQDCAWQATTQQSQGSVERINKGIKKVLGSLMRKNKDQYWVKYLNNTQYAITPAKLGRSNGDLLSTTGIGMSMLSPMSSTFAFLTDCFSILRICLERGENVS